MAHLPTLAATALLALLACEPPSMASSDASGLTDAARVDASLSDEERPGAAPEESAFSADHRRIEASAAALDEPSAESESERVEVDGAWDATRVLPTLPRSERPTPRRVAALPHLRLDGMHRALIGARRAAPGGDTYRAAGFRLRGAEVEVQLRAAVEAHLRPSPEDFVFYVEVEPVDDVEASAFATDPDQPPHGAEALALERLVERLQAAAAPSGVQVFRLRGGWADAVGGAYHGIALVDLESGEAIWVYRQETWYEC